MDKRYLILSQMKSQDETCGGHNKDYCQLEMEGKNGSMWIHVKPEEVAWTATGSDFLCSGGHHPRLKPSVVKWM